MSNEFTVGQWVWSLAHQAPARIIEHKKIWGYVNFLVWLLRDNGIHRVKQEDLVSLRERKEFSLSGLLYKLAAARINDALARDNLIAPAEGSVIPLPHQLYALNRAISGKQVRYLLADEVGLGKTIEAGLIIRELKLRGLVKRILVVAPKGLVNQWVQEMKSHFNEDFQLLIPGEFTALNRIYGQVNFWQEYDQVVCPLDAIKPVEARKGWSKEQLARYNQERFHNVIHAGWDLVVVDEAHRIGASTEAVARYKLGKALSEATPYLLLLTATPHQGKTDGFFRLMSLLDKAAFPNVNAIVKEQVAPYVIRTEKRGALDNEAKPLFKPRITRLVKVRWEARHSDQEELYRAVSDYVRWGYNQAMREKKNYVGFLMVLMQRMVTSSTRAIREALEKRLEVLAQIPAGINMEGKPDVDLWEMDSQELLEELLGKNLQGLKNERAEEEMLLALARQCELNYADAKAEKLLDIIHQLQLQENDEDVKVLVFTEFVATQKMLAGYLEEKGFKVAVLNGSMSLEERQEAQQAFIENCQVLVSTDAGGEGLNLQFCHVVVNYDLPWNPMRLEQRIGRVDRIGQKHTVKVFNFILAGTVEYRVQEVLEDKLKVILDEFGVDKFGDVLDSGQAEVDFTNAYVASILKPEHIEQEVEGLAQELREKADHLYRVREIIKDEKELDIDLVNRIKGLPLGQWLKTMTINYLLAHGGSVKSKLTGYDLVWPDETVFQDISFGENKAAPTGCKVLTLQEEMVANILKLKHVFVSGEPVPVLQVKGLPEGIKGYWALWRIGLNCLGRNIERMLPVFLTEEGKVYLPTARFIWERLMDEGQEIHFTGFKDGGDIPGLLEEKIQQQGYSLFKEMEQLHQERIKRKREKGELAFRLRREAISGLGLKSVKEYRLKQLDREERSWRERLRQEESFIPELTPVCVVFVEGC